MSTNEEQDNSFSTGIVDIPDGGMSDHDLRKHETFKEKLNRLLHSHRFHVAVVILVIIDCLLVIMELLVEMRVLQVAEQTNDHGKHDSLAAHILHNTSIAILSAFMVEICAKLYAFGIIGFLRHKLEVFDAVVVIVSFIFDVGFYSPEFTAGELIIVLRLWRVARILNGIVLTVKKQAEHKLEKEVKLRDNLMQELLTQRDYCNALEQDNKYLRELLDNNGIKAPPSVSRE